MKLQHFPKYNDPKQIQEHIDAVQAMSKEERNLIKTTDDETELEFPWRRNGPLMSTGRQGWDTHLDSRERNILQDHKRSIELKKWNFYCKEHDRIFYKHNGQDIDYVPEGTKFTKEEKEYLKSIL